MRRALLALPAASFATGTQAYVFTGLLQDLARDLSVSVGTAGQVATGFALASAFAAPFAAGLAGGIERRRVLVLALLATAVLNGLAALAPDFVSLLALRVAAAMAAAFVMPIASAAAMTLAAPQHRGRALALVSGGMTLAFVVGIPLGSVIGGLFSWRATFAFAGLLALLAAGLLRIALPRIAPQPRPPLGRALHAPGVRATLGICFLAFTATFSVVAYLGPVVNAVTGLSGAAVGAFQLCIGIGSLIGLAIGGRLADGPFARQAILALLLAMTVSLIGYSVLLGGALGPSRAMLAGVILLGALALFGLMPLLQSRLAAAAPASAPVLFGLNATMMFLGQAAGAGLGGLVTEVVGFASLGLAGAVAALLGLALAAALLPRSRSAPVPAGA